MITINGWFLLSFAMICMAITCQITMPADAGPWGMDRMGHSFGVFIGIVAAAVSAAIGVWLG